MIGRVAAVAALVVALVAVTVIVLSNGTTYQVRAIFENASQIVTGDLVEVAGNQVGTVSNIALTPNGQAQLTLQINNGAFEPLREGTTATVRAVSLSGIANRYVDLRLGPPNRPAIADNGVIPATETTSAVDLDQLFNTLNGPTRRGLQNVFLGSASQYQDAGRLAQAAWAYLNPAVAASSTLFAQINRNTGHFTNYLVKTSRLVRRAFRIWQQQLAIAVRGNGQNLNNVLGNLPAFAADSTDLLQVLDVPHTAVVNQIRHGGTVFAALNHDQSALRNLITTGEQTFATTAANDNSIIQTFHVFPALLDETKLTMTRLQRFAQNTDPLVTQLQPVAQNPGPTLRSVRILSPHLESLFTNLGPLIDASKTGLPAIRDVLHGAIPLLGSVGPFLEQLNPVLNWLSLHQQLISDFISNGATGLAAKTHMFGGNGTGHYLRQFAPVGAETLSFLDQSRSDNRGNTYPPPLWLAEPQSFNAGGRFPGSFALPGWDCNNTGAPGNGEKGASGVPSMFTQGSQACWVAPPLGPLVGQRGRLPRILAARYSSR